MRQTTTRDKYTLNLQHNLPGTISLLVYCSFANCDSIGTTSTTDYSHHTLLVPLVLYTYLLVVYAANYYTASELQHHTDTSTTLYTQPDNYARYALFE